MLVPTVEQIRAWSKLDFPSAGFGDDEALQVEVTSAAAWVAWATGRVLDDFGVWNVPTRFESLAAKAVRMTTEMFVKQGQEDYVESASDDVSTNFSVGGLSQAFEAPSVRTGKSSIGITPWPALNRLLWAFMTDEMRDYWWSLLNGVQAPAYSIDGVAWGAMGSTLSPAPPFGYGWAPGCEGPWPQEFGRFW